MALDMTHGTGWESVPAARKPRASKPAPAPVAPTMVPAPVAPTITLTTEQLQSIIDSAVQAVVAKYTAPAPVAPTLDTVPAPVAPCDACIVNMMAGIGLCALHAAPAACSACLATCVPCALHGGARPAPAAPFSYPASDKPVVSERDSKRATLREFRDLLSALSPRAIGDWQTKLGNATGKGGVLQDSAARLALRAYLRAAWEHSEHIKALETTIHQNGAPVVVPVLPYVRPIAQALLERGVSPSNRQAQYLIRYAQAEYNVLDALWTAARAGASATTVTTDSARTPQDYPQNSQYHSVGAESYERGEHKVILPNGSTRIVRVSYVDQVDALEASRAKMASTRGKRSTRGRLDLTA